MGLCSQRRVPGFQRDASHKTIWEVLPHAGRSTVPVEHPRHKELHPLYRIFPSSYLKGSSGFLSRGPFPNSQGAVSAAKAVYGAACVPCWARATESPGLSREVDPFPAGRRAQGKAANGSHKTLLPWQNLSSPPGHICPSPGSDEMGVEVNYLWFPSLS